MLFALVSCDKEEVAITDSSKVTEKEILTFATQEEFEQTLAKVNAMTKEERLLWEKEQGFKSFGTICDEFYESIKPENFISVKEVEDFVERNSDRIEFYIDSNNEKHCVSKNFLSNKRYIMNQNQMYVVGENVYKTIENELFVSNISNANNLIKAKSISDIKTDINVSAIKKAASSLKTKADASGTGKIGNDTYKVTAWIEVYKTNTDSFYTYMKIWNYSRSLGIWWFIEAQVTWDYRYNIQDSNGNSLVNSSSGGPKWVTSSNRSLFMDDTAWFPNKPVGTPYYNSYYCKVVNIINRNGGSVNCTAEMSY